MDSGWSVAAVCSVTGLALDVGEAIGCDFDEPAGLGGSGEGAGIENDDSIDSKKDSGKEPIVSKESKNDTGSEHHNSGDDGGSEIVYQDSEDDEGESKVEEWS